MQIFEYKKRIAEAETKLKQQQNLYEDVRTERNLFSKNLIEAKVSVHVCACVDLHLKNLLPMSMRADVEASRSMGLASLGNSPHGSLCRLA